MSSIWIQRDDAAAAPGRTHVLVVGTSHYRNLPQGPADPHPADRATFELRQVTTPATAAFRFAEWMRDAYRNPVAPLASIRLLLSPSEVEKQAVPELAAPGLLPATRANVETALDEWYEACSTARENVAILYASGHGIQLSKDEGGIVLLEDFATRPTSVLDHALHVGRVKQGMAGPSMAQNQFFFVDACEIRPEALGEWQKMGEPLGLGVPLEGAPRSSAVYFSAAPGTAALGEPGAGTLFCQALLECLSLGAVEADREGQWVVTSLGLIPALRERVEELAAAHGTSQTATSAGLPLDDVPFHVLAEPPEVPLTITVDPETATSCAFARIWDAATQKAIVERAPFAPVVEQKVPAGLWLLVVEIDPATPPYVGSPTLPLAAKPPSTATTVKVV